MTDKKPPKINQTPTPRRGLADAAAELDYLKVKAPRPTVEALREIQIERHLHHGLLPREFSRLTNSELKEVIAVCLQLLDKREALASVPTSEELGR